MSKTDLTNLGMKHISIISGGWWVRFYRGGCGPTATTPMSCYKHRIFHHDAYKGDVERSLAAAMKWRDKQAISHYAQRSAGFVKRGRVHNKARYDSAYHRAGVQKRTLFDTQGQPYFAYVARWTIYHANKPDEYKSKSFSAGRKRTDAEAEALANQARDRAIRNLRRQGALK